MENRDLLSQTAQIVSSHLSNNPVTQDQIPSLIREVYNTLTDLGQGISVEGRENQPVRPSPAVPVMKSVFPDHIVCLEDGKKLKMLKRHLMTSFRMTPDDYRKRWDLPPDYPMVAPKYAQTRSSLAKKAGLGHRRIEEDEPEPILTATNGTHHSTIDDSSPEDSSPTVRRIPEGISGKRPPGRPRKNPAAAAA
jgi:predicted transcriptional regulator